MAERRNADPGFVDMVTAGLGGPRTSAMLERLDAAVPWEELAGAIRGLYGEPGGAGRPYWSPVVMLKATILAKWFSLSDPQLEEQLHDRLSFRRFVGLSLDDATPDETTFVIFRRRLREAGLERELFARVVAHIESRGLLMRTGTMVDATIIEAPRGRGRGDGTSTRDEDAKYTRKHGRTYHGYKGHIACDLSGIMTDYRFRPANENDSMHIDALTEHETYAVIADSAYSSHARRGRLRARGVIDAITYPRVRYQEELHDIQRYCNAIVAKVRATVEHPFAMMKEQFRYRKVRYRGLERNAFDFCLTLIACNIKRSLSLSPP